MLTFNVAQKPLQLQSVCVWRINGEADYADFDVHQAIPQPEEPHEGAGQVVQEANPVHEDNRLAKILLDGESMLNWFN